MFIKKCLELRISVCYHSNSSFWCRWSRHSTFWRFGEWMLTQSTRWGLLGYLAVFKSSIRLLVQGSWCSLGHPSVYWFRVPGVLNCTAWLKCLPPQVVIETDKATYSLRLQSVDHLDQLIGHVNFALSRIFNNSIFAWVGHSNPSLSLPPPSLLSFFSCSLFLSIPLPCSSSPPLSPFSLGHSLSYCVFSLRSNVSSLKASLSKRPLWFTSDIHCIPCMLKRLLIFPNKDTVIKLLKECFNEDMIPCAPHIKIEGILKVLGRINVSSACVPVTAGPPSVG